MKTYATRATFAAALQHFINDELPRVHSRLKCTPNVDLDTPLFASGLIDSLAILHLIAWIETATARSIGIEEVVMSRFQTVDAIAQTFWQPPVTA